MSRKSKCPKCQKEFKTKAHLKSGVRADLPFVKYAIKSILFPFIDGLEGVYEPNLVVCPGCGNEFISKDYKFFGFIGPKHFQIGLAVSILFFLFVFLAGMLWSAFIIK
jgi:hypothetical protein